MSDSAHTHPTLHQSPEARSLQWMVTLAAHLDTHAPYNGLPWLPADSPDERVVATAHRLRETLAQEFVALERVLAVL